MLAELQPDVVGMTVLTPSEPVCSALTRMIRATVPAVKIVWGAVHADVFAADIVMERKADFVIHHDGEESICELLDAIESGENDFSAVDGITWRALDGTPVKNKDRRLLTDLDSLPYPAWHLFPYHRYGLLPFADFAKPVLTMTGSRGCPYRCDYCSLINTGGKVYRRRDPIKVVDEYEYWLIAIRSNRRFVDPIFPLVKKDCVHFMTVRQPGLISGVSG